MKIIKKMWHIFDGKQKIRFIELMFLILVGTVLETLGVTAIIPFISAIMYPDKILKNQYGRLVYNLFGFTNINQLIILLAIVLMVVFVAKDLYLCWMYHVQFRFVHNNQRRLSYRLMACYISQPYKYHVQHNSTELLHNIMNDVDMFYSTVLYMINVITDGCVCITLAVVLFITDKTITLGVGALILVFILTFYRWYKKEISLLGDQRRIYSQKSLQSLQQAFGGIKETKVLGREEYFKQIYDYNYHMMMEAKRKVNTYSMMPKPLMEALCIVALLTVVAVKISRGVDVDYFIPTLSVFALAVVRILPSSSRLTSNISSLLYGKSSVDVVYEDLQEVEILTRQQDEGNADFCSEIPFKESIELKDIVFYYDNNDKCILDHIALTIPKNKSVAFVGTSGSGKTTLVDIILGVLECQEGKLLVDGVPLKSNTKAWQRKLGYIPQNIYITDDTIRRNVAFGIEDNEIDDARIWEALQEAQLKEFVEGLEYGLDTEIGECGARISGGQRQRIGIARALYHNPEILVLDEATSALDTETEKAVMESVNALSGRKTLIIIAHRLTTIENCDLVYRVENGKVELEKS